LFGKVALAFNLTFSPGEKEQLSRVTIFREPSGQSHHWYFQSRREREKPSPAAQAILEWTMGAMGV
jgi:hypothetical protein